MASESDRQSIHGVLDSGATRELFEETAAELGLVKQDTWEAEGEGESYEQVWTTPDQTLAVNYVEDPLSGMSYVHFRGADLEELTEEFGDKLSTFWPDELIGLYHEATELDGIGHNEIVDYLYRLAIAFPDYDPEVFAIFEEAATEAPHPKLRLAALDALLYRTWPQSRAVVERVAQTDADAEVREQAARILTRWDGPQQQTQTQT